MCQLMKGFLSKIIILVSLIPVARFTGCTNTGSVINVRNYGAIPDDKKDDTPAIMSAIEACRNKKNPKLVFEWGTYDIYGSKKDPDGHFRPAIEVKDLDNLIFDGQGCEFTGHDYASLFHFEKCRDISIMNLSVDWDPLPYTQGRVVKVDSGYVDMEVAAPFTAREGLHTEALLGYDPERHRMARRFTDHYQLGYEKPTVIVAPGVMRLFISRQDRFAGKMPSVGMDIIARHQVYDYQSFEFVKCTDVRIGNVSIFSNPGMGVTGKECMNITIRHLKVMIKPGSGRWMSCTADATNFSGCRGKIIMENCLFEGQGDDATNVRSGEYLLVAERPDDHRLLIKRGYRYGGDPVPPEVGDKLELSGADKLLLPYATLTVRSVVVDTEAKTITVGFTEKLPDRTRKGDIAGNASSCPVLRIRNCTAIRNRARGFIVKTRDVIIEDCTFQDICASAIGLEADVNAWWESIGSGDVIIRNNRFIDCRFEPEYLHGVIESHTMSETAPAGVHRRISIDNNIFLGSDGNIIKLGSADGVEITGNLMDRSREEAILLYNSRNVRIFRNKLTNCKTGLTIGSGCDASTITTGNNIGL